MIQRSMTNEVTVESSGKAVVDPVWLLRMLKSETSELTVALDGNMLEITAPMTRSACRVVEAEYSDWPKIFLDAQPHKGYTIYCNAKLLMRVLQGVMDDKTSQPCVGITVDTASNVKPIIIHHAGKGAFLPSVGLALPIRFLDDDKAPWVPKRSEGAQP